MDGRCTISPQHIVRVKISSWVVYHSSIAHQLIRNPSATQEEPKSIITTQDFF